MTTQIDTVQGVHPMSLGTDAPIDVSDPGSKWAVLAEQNPRQAILQAKFGTGQTLTMRVASTAAPTKSGNRASFPLSAVADAEWLTHKDHVKFLVTYSGKPASNIVTVDYTASGVSLVLAADGSLDIIGSNSAKVGSIPVAWIEYLPDGLGERQRFNLRWDISSKSISLTAPDLSETEWATAVIDPTVVTTSTAATATAYTNQRKIARTSNGVLWTLFWNGAAGITGNPMSLRYSTDNGSTWLDGGGFGFASFDAVYVPDASLFIDIDDYAHVTYKDRHNGQVYYRRGTPNAGRTSYTWTGNYALTGATSLYGYSDVVAHREGTGWTAHVVASFHGATCRATYSRISITSGGSISVTDLSATTLGTYTGSGPSYPSIDFNHTGDGKTVAGGTPHLYAAWSGVQSGVGNGIRFMKATYSGGTWTWGADREIDNTRSSAGVLGLQLNCLYDGTRVIIGGLLYDNTNYDQMLYERDAADTTTTTRVLIDNATAANRLAYCSMSYDPAGNVHMVGRFNDGADKLGYYEWTRATTTLSSMTTVDAGTSSAPYPSAKRGYEGNLYEFVYADGTANPYSVTYGSFALNAGPSAPTNLALDETRVLAGSTVTLSWQHNDPDGDPQDRLQVRYRKVNV